MAAWQQHIMWANALAGLLKCATARRLQVRTGACREPRRTGGAARLRGRRGRGLRRVRRAAVPVLLHPGRGRGGGAHGCVRTGCCAHALGAVPHLKGQAGLPPTAACCAAALAAVVQGLQPALRAPRRRLCSGHLPLQERDGQDDDGVCGGGDWRGLPALPAPRQGPRAVAPPHQDHRGGWAQGRGKLGPAGASGCCAPAAAPAWQAVPQEQPRLWTAAAPCGGSSVAWLAVSTSAVASATSPEQPIQAMEVRIPSWYLVPASWRRNKWWAACRQAAARRNKRRGMRPATWRGRRCRAPQR